MNSNALTCRCIAGTWLRSQRLSLQPKQTWPLFDWSTCPWACWCCRPPPWCSPWGTPAPCRAKVHATSPPRLWCWPRSWRSLPACCWFSRSTVSSWLIKALFSFLLFFFFTPAGELAGLLPALLRKICAKLWAVMRGITVKEHLLLAVLWSGVASFIITTRQMKQIKGPVWKLKGHFAVVWQQLSYQSEAHAK